MSTQAPPAPQPASAASLQPPIPGEACPLCGAALAADQEWCLHCGAAARTRLAAAPNWRAPLAALAVVIALGLGVLIVALVKLAGDSGPPPPAITRTVTTPAATPPATTPGATTAPGATTVPGATTAPGTATTTPGTATTTPGAVATTPGAATTPGTATTPGATTTPGTATTPGATTAPGGGATAQGKGSPAAK